MALHETIPIARHQTTADLAAGEFVCPVCSREARDSTIELDQLPDDLAALIRANALGSVHIDAVCERCVRLFERAKDQIIAEAAVTKDGSHVLSTPLRLDADDRFTGA